jgi:hypothetical protein
VVIDATMIEEKEEKEEKIGVVRPARGNIRQGPGSEGQNWQVGLS